MARHPYVTVDTEFHRETTFWPILCLVQLAGDDEALAIDALAPEIDLKPLFALMADPHVLKVFHAARQDVEIFWKLAGVVPSPMFDTQVAAMVCGYGEQVSYSELVQSICHTPVDKSSRFTDWVRRPLAKAQIDYAIGDVTHLREIYRTLLAKLKATERLAWLEDEMRVLTSASTYEQHPERAWERFKNRARKPRDLAVLMEVAAWRESEAQARDVPRSRVLKDDILIEVALAAPRTQEALGNLRAIPRGMERSRAGEEILAAVERGLARDPKTLPKLERERRGGAGSAATVELLKVLLRQISDESGVAGKMIATVDDLEAIAGNDKADVAGSSGLAPQAVRRACARTQTGAAGLDGGEGQGRRAGMARGGPGRGGVIRFDIEAPTRTEARVPAFRRTPRGHELVGNLYSGAAFSCAADSVHLRMPFLVAGVVVEIDRGRPHRYVMVTHSEEASDCEDIGPTARVVERDVLDASDFFMVVVVDRQANDLGAQFVLRRHRGERTRVGRSLRGRHPVRSHSHHRGEGVPAPTPSPRRGLLCLWPAQRKSRP